MKVSAISVTFIFATWNLIYTTVYWEKKIFIPKITIPRSFSAFLVPRTVCIMASTMRNFRLWELMCGIAYVIFLFCVKNGLPVSGMLENNLSCRKSISGRIEIPKTVFEFVQYGANFLFWQKSNFECL